MVQLLTVSTSWFAFLSARSLEWATVYVLDLGFFEARCLHLPYNEEVMFAQAAFWTGFSVKLVTDISRVRKEPCFRALYLVTRSVIVSIPLPGYLWRKDVLLFRFMKWQERPWGKNKQSVHFSLPRSLVWHFERVACWSFSTRRAAVIKAKTEECIGEGQAELVSLWGRAAGYSLCSGSMVKTQLRNTEV